VRASGHTRWVRGIGPIALTLIVFAAAGCGQVRTDAPSRARTVASAPSLLEAHPQAIEPVAGASAPIVAGAGAGATPAQVSVGTANSSLAAPISEAQVRAQLIASGISPSLDRATLTPDGLAIAPLDAPPAVQEVIAAANQIAHLPYRWGGGHATYEDTAYDCSGSISFVFEAAHLLNGPVVSGQLMNWGDRGPGKWITVFANAGHTFMYVAGLRFDTVALAETGSRWSNRSADEPDLSSFAVRHPPAL
jgi:hypothetical protein